MIFSGPCPIRRWHDQLYSLKSSPFRDRSSFGPNECCLRPIEGAPSLTYWPLPIYSCGRSRRFTRRAIFIRFDSQCMSATMSAATAVSWRRTKVVRHMPFGLVTAGKAPGRYSGKPSRAPAACPHAAAHAALCPPPGSHKPARDSCGRVQSIVWKRDVCTHSPGTGSILACRRTWPGCRRTQCDLR